MIHEPQQKEQFYNIVTYKVAVGTRSFLDFRIEIHTPDGFYLLASSIRYFVWTYVDALL